MRKYILIPIVLVLAVGAVSAEHPAVQQAEELRKQARLEQALTVLETGLGRANSTPEKAELYVALSHYTLEYADGKLEAGAHKNELMPLYAEGEEYGNKAVELDPDNYEAYFWRASNGGRWGQLKGVFNALDKAKEMQADLEKAVSLNPDYALSWYALGQLYEQVPGFAFGNKDYAVSFGRKSVDSMLAEIRRGTMDEIHYDFYTQLARHLYARNWNDRRRTREYTAKRDAYRSKTSPLDKNSYYEGTTDLENQSDRDEAKDILQWVIREMEGERDRSRQMNEDLRAAREAMNELF